MPQTQIPLGQVVITAAANSLINRGAVLAALQRHRNGDWGNICPEDRKVNDHAVKHGERLLSVYTDSRDTTFWIITEWDRSITTVLLPSDY